MGWLTAVGADSAATVIMSRRILRSVKAEAVTEVPNFINSPLDILGSSICDLICPILFKIAHADGHLLSQEREKIQSYFINEWGINAGYVDGLLKFDEANLRDFEWDSLRTTLESIEKSGDIKYSSMAEEIIAIADEVTACDKEVHPNEQLQMEKLRQSLRKETLIDSVKQGLKKKFPKS